MVAGFRLGTGTRHFCVTLKPKNFPNRVGRGRFLDQFDMLITRSVAGALLDDHDNKNCRARPSVASQ
jgi:hypothetical protein